MKFRLSILILCALVLGCSTTHVRETALLSDSQEPERNYFFLSNGVGISIVLPPSDWRLRTSDTYDLEDIDYMLQVFEVSYDKPRSFFKEQPYIFNMGMNIIENEGDGYQDLMQETEGFIKKTSFSQGGLEWTCTYFSRLFEGRSDRKRTCVAALGDHHTIVCYMRVTPWVRLSKSRMDRLEKMFIESFSTIEIHKYE